MHADNQMSLEIDQRAAALEEQVIAWRRDIHRHKAAAPNHSPRFFVDESGLLLGVRSLAQLTADYLQHT